jgi:uncharacterized protein DUF2442
MRGTHSSPDEGARVRDVQVTADSLRVVLTDGRSISAPLSWYPRLLKASPADRGLWELSAAGQGVHWPLLDEDISVAGLLRGAASPEFEGC